MSRSEARTAARKYWWVNQGRGYKAQRERGYIWAPKLNSQGRQLHHWTNVRTVSQGDVLLHYANGAIRALGQAEEDAREAERPDGLPKGAWDKDGYLARVRMRDLDDPIQLKDIPSELRAGRKGGPFNNARGVNQGYLFPLGDDHADLIRRHFLERWPSKSPWGRMTEDAELDRHQLALMRAEFLARTPGFQAFHPPRGPYRYWERDYKDETSRRVRSELVPLLREAPVDRAVASQVIKTTQSILKDRLDSTGAPQNLISWRYYDFLAKLRDEQESRFAHLLRALLLGTKDSSDRVEQFNREFVELYRVAAGERPGAAITRSFPTLFLMLNDPGKEMFIRTRLFNRLAKKLTGNNLFTGQPLDAESYRRAITFARNVKAALANWGWNPVDMIDVQSFLWVSGTPSFQAQTSSWIFQVNPKYFDIEGALRSGNRFGTYNVAQHRGKIAPGDRIYFWVSGQNSGIVGTGTVIEPPAERQDFAWERSFYRDDVRRFEQPRIAVRFEVGGALSKRLKRAALMEDATLKNLAILRAPQGTNYSLTTEESDAIEQLLGKVRTPDNDGAVPGTSDEPVGFDDLMSRFTQAGLYFPTEAVSNYLLALQTKGFVILTGISGTGKTKLAMQVSRSLAAGHASKCDDYLCVVAVRPDWTDNRGLIGWHNPITNTYVLTPALKFLLRAQDEIKAARAEGRAPRPYFLVLDEMNIARVEHYLSDFLSCLESGMPLQLHDEAGLGVPKELWIPYNVFITGTVNVDETTYNFSPKVLDRAFTIELNRVDLRQLGQPSHAAADDHVMYLRELVPMLQEHERERHGATHDDWQEFIARADGKLAEVVTDLNERLTTENRHFGYRVATEIARFTNLAAKQAGDRKETLWAALDLALMEKVLPKFHGTQQELEGVLRELFSFSVDGSSPAAGHNVEEEWDIVGNELRPLASTNVAVDAPRLPRMALKVRRMIRRLKRQGFTSFIE